jgi:membrane fusion protein (multidrug efflux system)
MNKKQKRLIANTIIIALLLGGVAWIASLFVHLGGAYTNNAQVRQHIVPVSSRVQGFVKKIFFDEFQHVRKGDTLLLIEDCELRLRVAQAEANYQNALAGKSAMGTSISTTQNNLSVSDAGIEEAAILLRNAEKDFQRYKKLLAEESVTQQQFDGAKTSYDALQAKYEMLVRQKQSTALVRDEQTQRLDVETWHAASLQSALELAKLNLSYTVILAPCDGYTSRKTIQEGELVMPGRHLLAVESDEQKWVVANYRETQLRHIRLGSKAAIYVDAFPDHPFEGEVTAISNATGAQYSPAAPDNSAGNFVKVEQRIPVKILFSASNESQLLSLLGAGMNAECNILY